MEQKAWKDIPGYGGRYQARMDGQVSRKYKNGKRKIFSQYTRKPAHGSKRYYVKLTDPETRKAKDEPVHQIVLKTFVGPCPEGCIPIHKNGIPEDNFLTNLCYMSKAAVGKKVGGKSKRKPVAKIDSSGEIVAFYSSAREAGRENHMSYQTIIDRCNGKCKGIFAPDGYAYSWDEDRKTEAAIRRIKALRKVKEESHV